MIRDAVMRHKERDIPIAVSMANVAASGGYWVSTPADRIFAEPETITGSIGIFAVIPTFEETAAMAGAAAVEGAEPLRYNHFKVPLMENLVKRAVRDA